MKRHPTKQTRGITKDSAYFHEFERFSKKVRERIQELRNKKGLTQEKMADFEMNIRQFQRIEGGETKNLTLSNLFKIAKALGVKPAELIDV